MAGTYRKDVDGGIYYDTSTNGYPLAAYQCLSWASDAEVAAAQAAGNRGDYGTMVVPTPVAAGKATRRIIGISDHSCKDGQEIRFVTGGIAEVMVNAACTRDTRLHAALQPTRTTAQTPLTNLLDLLIPMDPSVTLTYNFCLADDTADVLTTGAGTNVLIYPIGYALKAATAQYDVIPVELFLTPIYI